MKHTGTATNQTVLYENYFLNSSLFLSVPPDPPILELNEVKNYAISLFWTPGFEGSSPITGFYLEYKASNGEREVQWGGIITLIHDICR